MISRLLLLRQVFLAIFDTKLKFVDTDDAGNPLTDIRHTLLICDVWKHAWYLDYRKERPEYLEAFWQRVNRDFVAPNLTPRP